ncbi:helix-turn-helix transcriptional regulator [Sulfitobacter sp. M57]|uniref:helix-turn-helix domain-containing protein n=1 Tax=unclassified Sulfitobacter TaxID=196795 RepID=UPI0023E28429|nr:MULTISPECIES: helix-turn-helix transcriptional regulator [unclassified Sulfitobacter]MDF3413096.1 helix-turn-helix transcriptional regulator [Sulfitobacter sp. KE5]MDF3421621.1 helix-turn-helix transcriptional regulator [Sulfitobacter sp. KE43]MDF3431645.1 helix-turn-helix transcriptional regulator [Sulfitobacter sp. KE42]MDF3457286.1 helix-turn-helix transcriptional regulator [Sulfitobacter sp. S74]MDF3461188.1 helix-turn-helix transcriptional regulator [Sulfitobacter sp. Ks18]
MTDETDWYSPEAATFGDRVAAARERAGMTQGVLAKRLGVKLATLRAWEEDRSEPRANRLSILAGLLNVSMMWLINSEGEGIDAPQDAEAVGEDMQTILADIRLLRTEMLANVENLGRLEKRLRLALEAPQHG